MRTFMVLSRFGFLVLASWIILSPGGAQQPTKPYKVKIVGEKDNVAGGVMPVDPKVRVAYQYKGGFGFAASVDGRSITNDVRTLFKIDERITTPAAGQKGQKLQDLPEGPGGKKRYGGRATWEQDGVRVTMSLEAVPGKQYQPQSAGTTRRMDTLLVKYSIENNSNVPHRFACRVSVNSAAISQPGLRYASPTTHPKTTLLGVVLEKANLPSFIEALEKDNLRDPGLKGVLTFKFGERLEGPGKIVLTRSTHANNNNQWDALAEPGGNSCCVLYWEQRDLQPKAKRELAYAYGQGIAMVNEGLVSANFGGSFDPGKSFIITAYVDGPFEGQSLTLQLPKAIERISGKAAQIVPMASESSGQSVVMWRCRVLETGTYPIAIRSSNGVTRTWTVTVSPPE